MDNNNSNYFIAVGGTGERVARAVMHLCDCGQFGIGDQFGNNRVKEIKLMIIDPDEGNGNKKSLNRMLDRYCDCYDWFWDDNCNFFSTKISKAILDSGDIKADWAVSPVKGAPGQSANDKPYTLNDYLTNEDVPVATNFMRALYNREEYELKNMKDGFFAHPSIGAHTFARWLESSPEFQSLLEGIRGGLMHGDVKVFIAGSAFGGTGASGFPAVAKKIRSFVDQLPGRTNNEVIISGAFFLPYFTFEYRDIDNNQVDEEGSIKYEHFLKAAKNALSFYDTYKSDRSFNRVYVLGAPSKGGVVMTRNFYADKGEGQDNWPHMLELFGALSAKDFFEADDASFQSEVPDRPYWYGAGVVKDSFGQLEWKDLPNSQNFERLLNRFLLMSYIYVPAVINHFIEQKNGSTVIRSYKEHGKSFEPIASKPFINGAFIGKDWSDEFRKTGYTRFVGLNDYFFGHAKWYSQLISGFQRRGYGQVIFKQLIKGDILQKRAKNEWNTETLEDDLGLSVIGVDSFKYGSITPDLNRKISTNQNDVNGAIGVLIRGIYDTVSKYIR